MLIEVTTLERYVGKRSVTYLLNRKMSKKKLNKKIKKFEKIEREALHELALLKEYYREKGYTNIESLMRIKVYLTSIQKNLNYFGLRGLFPTVLGAILVYFINNNLLEMILNTKTEEEWPWFIYIIFYILIGLVIGIIIFFILIPLILFIKEDWNVRKEILKNEIMINKVESDLERELYVTKYPAETKT